MFSSIIIPMRELKDYLRHFEICGFTVLPLDQAREAFWRPTYFLAHKFIFNENHHEKFVVLQLILGNLKQLAIVLPSCFTCPPNVQIGFCGQTILINQKAYRLNDLMELDESDRLAK